MPHEPGPPRLSLALRSVVAATVENRGRRALLTIARQDADDLGGPDPRRPVPHPAASA